MKTLFLIVLILSSLKIFAEETSFDENDNARFNEEFKVLESDSKKSDEVKITNSAVLKEIPPTELMQNENNENLFFKTEEVKPRRIRSR
jgi:hypothetical protein